MKKAQQFALSTLGLLVLSGIWTLGSSTSLSSDSLKSLESLNQKYQMNLVPLTEEAHMDSMSTLFQANSLSNLDASDHKGIILNFGSGQFFLLEPSENMNDEDLEQVATDYLEQIPELEDFELDQELTLSNGTILVPNKLNEENLSPSSSPVSLDAQNSSKEVSPPTVAIIDSGISDHELFHQKNVTILSGIDFTDHDEDPNDEVGHGTHISGIIASNHSVVILPIKVYGANGGKLSDLVSGLDYAIDSDVQIINMSLGLFEPSETLSELVQEASDQGIIIVAAAGNENQESCFYPACYKDAIAVSGVTTAHVKTLNSNYGDWIDVAGPGIKLWSAAPGNSYTYKQGTSQAAAYVTSVFVDLYLDQGTLNDEIVSTYLASLETVDRGPLKGVPVVPFPVN